MFRNRHRSSIERSNLTQHLNSMVRSSSLLRWFVLATFVLGTSVLAIIVQHFGRIQRINFSCVIIVYPRGHKRRFGDRRLRVSTFHYVVQTDRTNDLTLFAFRLFNVLARACFNLRLGHDNYSLHVLKNICDMHIIGDICAVIEMSHFCMSDAVPCFFLCPF